MSKKKKSDPLIVVSEEELERVVLVSNEDCEKIAKLAEEAGCSWESAACILLRVGIGMAQTSKPFWKDIVANLKEMEAERQKKTN